jgi:ribose transport system substrate-binding protein
MPAFKPLAMLAALLLCAQTQAQGQSSPLPATTALTSIGISVSDLGNPYFVEIARGAERRAREIGGDQVRVQVVSSAYDLPRQIRQIDTFINDGVQLILLSAADRDGIAPAVERARKAGIPVIAVDVEAAGADVTITTDNRVAGNLACDYLAQRIGGAGKVVVINGPAVSSVIERVQGCYDALADFAGIEVLSDTENGGGAREGGLEKMTALMTAYPEIQGVFTINDPTALGAVPEQSGFRSRCAAPRIRRRLRRTEGTRGVQITLPQLCRTVLKRLHGPSNNLRALQGPLPGSRGHAHLSRWSCRT